MRRYSNHISNYSLGVQNRDTFFYKEGTTLFQGNQNIRYWSYYYIHPQTGEQYQITLQDAKTHLDNWIKTGGHGWDLPSSGPQVGLGPIIPKVFLFEKPRRHSGR